MTSPSSRRSAAPYRPHRKGAGGNRPQPTPGRDAEGPTLIFGIHAVESALANPARRVVGAWLTENAERRLAAVLATRGLAVERVLPRDLDRRLGSDTVHQGALLEADPLPDTSLDQLAALADGGRPVLVLDQVTDPHNVGAVLRSAAVFGAAGLVMTRRHSPPLGSTLAKSASGALDLVPIALVPNLARALVELKNLEFTVLGLDSTGPHLLEDEALPERVVLVLGAEGRGLRQLTRETCDRTCRILTDGPLDSLNVSNAAAVALHHAAQSRRARR